MIEWICSERQITLCVKGRPGYARGLESGLSVASQGDKGQ